MKQQVSFDTFYDAFRAYGRLDNEDGQGGNFTQAGLRVLFDSLEDYEESCGEEMTLDVIGLCWDYSEDTAEEIAQSYNIDLSECEDDHAKLETVLAHLYEYTSVCGVTRSEGTESSRRIVYQQF